MITGMSSPLPLARQKDLISHELSGELLVYDLTRNKVHCLNPATALVWRSCDGKRTMEELASLVSARLDLPADEDIVRLALAHLEKARLLEAPLPEATAARRLSRRQLVKRLGIGLGALPLLSTLVAPPAHAAGSCQSSGATCNPRKPCCSGACDSGTNKCL